MALATSIIKTAISRLNTKTLIYCCNVSAKKSALLKASVKQKTVITNSRYLYFKLTVFLNNFVLGILPRGICWHTPVANGLLLMNFVMEIMLFYHSRSKNAAYFKLICFISLLTHISHCTLTCSYFDCIFVWQ